MLTLIRLFFKYFVPIVLFFALVSFFEPSHYPDKPIDADPVGRLLSAIIGTATFTGDGFSRAWSVYWSWLYGDRSFDASNMNAVVELLKYLVIGYVLNIVLLAPVYAFGWATGQERLWVVRFITLCGNGPVFGPWPSLFRRRCWFCCPLFSYPCP